MNGFFVPQRFHLFIGLICLGLWAHQPAQAFQTLAESGELISSGSYRLGFETQFANNGNITGFVDAPINEASSIRVHLGVGDVDFYTGASYKWMPFPDTENQPAMGLKTGVTIGRESTENFFVYHFSPLFSKKWALENATLIPYAGLPISFTTYKSNNVTGYQLTLGSEISIPTYPEWGFGIEFSSALKDSQSYSALYVTILTDEKSTKPAAK